MNRGDVILVDFPYTTGLQSKVRPALIVQSDHENQRISNTIIALITGNLQRADQLTHLLIDPSSPEGATSGLHGKSLVSCINLFTVNQKNVIQTIGRLSTNAMSDVDECLCAALHLK